MSFRVGRYFPLIVLMGCTSTTLAQINCDRYDYIRDGNPSYPGCNIEYAYFTCTGSREIGTAGCNENLECKSSCLCNTSETNGWSISYFNDCTSILVQEAEQCSSDCGVGGGGGVGGGICFEDPGNCVEVGGQWQDCNCVGSPILIGSQNNSIQLTSVDDGVDFDLDKDGIAERMAWTDPASDAAFLALDRNGNNLIDDGGELFGNYTSQPPSKEPNGFLALAVFDTPQLGGNADQQISAEDAVFAELLLWTDTNHDGLSQPDELLSLREAAVAAIDLSYWTSRRRDRHGNLLRYFSLVHLEGPNTGRRRLAIDVFLVRASE